MIGWNIGDVAVCVDDELPASALPEQAGIFLREIRAGRSYLISAVSCSPHGLGLHFCGIPSIRSAGYREDRFFKVELIEPLHLEIKEYAHGIA